MEELRNVMPLLQSLGISPDQLTPEKMSMLQQLSKAFADPNNINEEAINKLTRKLGLNIDGKPKVPKKKEEKIGRNEKCPCNSGKKYKKCCGDVTKN
jgi:uncharacterized protein YecA (UPF0149 family)